MNHTSHNHLKSRNNDHSVHRAACYLHVLMGQVRSKHPDLLTSLARHSGVWDLCLAGVPDSLGNYYKPEVKGQGFWLTELTQRSPLTRLTAPQSWSDRIALQNSQRNIAQTENSWLISHLKIISGCMPGWLNEKIRIPHSNWIPYCEYQMETFRNLPGFHRISPPLFRKRKYPFIPLSLPVFSLLLILFSRLLFKLKKKHQACRRERKRYKCYLSWQERLLLLLLFPPKTSTAMRNCTSGEKALWLRAHTNTLCEKGKRRLR